MKKVISIWPVILIFGIWFIFSSPFFIKNLAPYPSLFQSNFFSPWSAYGIYEGPVKNNAMPDIVTQIYPWRVFTIESLKTGEIPFWNPYSFAGTPHLANYQSAPFFPLNIIFFLPISFIDSWTILVILQPLIAALSMYLLLRNFNLSKTPSLFGSISFMFCGFITSWMGYSTLGYAIALLPLSFYFINKFIETKKNYFGLLVSLTIAFSLLAGHFQTSIYFLLALFAYIIFTGLKSDNKKIFAFLLICFACGFAISLPQVLPSIEFYFNSVRQSIVTQLEVIPLNYLPTLFAPDFFGNPVTRNDWLGHYAEWNGFSGTITVVLAIFSTVFLFKRDKRILFFASIAILSLLTAFDTPLNLLIFKLNLPLFSTSASSRVIVLFSFAISVLSAFALNYLIVNKDRIRKKILILIILFTIVLSILWAIPLLNIFNDLEKTQIAKSNLFLPTILSFGFIFLLLLVFLFKKSRVALFIFSLGALLLITGDMLRFAIKWMPFEPKDFIFKEVGVTEFYKKHKNEGRFLGNFSAENSVFYKIQILDGYDPLYPSRYGEFVKYVELGRKEDGDRSVVGFPLNSARTKKAIDFLGVKYIPQKKSDDGQPWSFDFNSYPIDDFNIAFEDDSYRVFENNNSFPRAFVVTNYEIENNDSRILRKMFEEDFSLREKIILEKDPQIAKSEENESDAKIVEYNPNNVILEVNSEKEGLLILTDNYYSGWKAYVNDQESEILRANYTFRAVKIPSGTSVVEFDYEPKSFTYGVYLGIAGFCILLAIYIYTKKYGFKD